MNADDRRELVLDAATRAFGRTGYAGTTTDTIAKEAQVSQPYVVRIFGTKLDLFLEVFERCTARVHQAFSDVLADGAFDPDDDADWERLGIAYTALIVQDRSALGVMMHGFAAGGDERIGAAARTRMAQIFDLVLSTGATDEQAREFVAQGMLLNIMLAMNAPEHLHESTAIERMSTCAFGEVLELIPHE